MPLNAATTAVIRRTKFIIILSAIAIFLALATLSNDGIRERAGTYFHRAEQKTEEEEEEKPKIRYLPEPEWTPPPIQDPWPPEWDTQLPPVPPWNAPRPDMHQEYNIPYAPPLLIGFSRTYPILLQAIVSYITAGWPASQIYVIENTGVQDSNTLNKLTLQNPYYLNHTQLHILGVNIIQTPVLLTFAQLQNYFIHLARTHSWPHYFWGHQDILTLSYESGEPTITPPATETGYKSVYELCLLELQRVRQGSEKVGTRFFAYDHLTLVNRAAYEEVGGWDPFIPYYMGDCEFHTRVLMLGYTMRDAKAGVMTDVSTVLKDLRALYRVVGVEVGFVDVNPPPPEGKGKGEGEKVERRGSEDSLEYYRQLRDVSDRMFQYKHGNRGRNTWQQGGRGGEGEPYFYPSLGIQVGVEILTEAGKDVFAKKWGRRDCDLIGNGLKYDDAWKVEPA